MSTSNWGLRGRKGRVSYLSLWNINDTATHTPNEHHASRTLSLNHVLRNFGRAQVRSVDIDSPELLHAVVRVFFGFENLREARRRDEDVDVGVVLREDLRDGIADRVWG